MSEKRTPIVIVVLAAGEGRRADGPKALLELGWWERGQALIFG